MRVIDIFPLYVCGGLPIRGVCVIVLLVVVCLCLCVCVGAHGRVATIWSDRDGRNGESHHKLRSVPLKLKVGELEKEKLRACVYMCVRVCVSRVYVRISVSTCVHM